MIQNHIRVINRGPLLCRLTWVERLEQRRLLSAAPVSDEFTAGTYMAFYGKNQLEAVNLASAATRSFPLSAWNQEFTFTAGSGPTAENILAFYSGQTLTTVNLTSQVETSYIVGNSTEQWTAGTVAAFYNRGILTTLDVGSGETNTYNLGNFSQEFTLSSMSTASSVNAASSNILAFYGAQTLITINVVTQNQTRYGVGNFTQEYSLTVGSGNTGQAVMGFFTNGTLTTVNLITQAATSYTIGQGATDVFSAGSVLAFYDGGTLATVDVGSGAMNSYSIGNFTQEFTASSSGTGAAVVNNVLAFYGNRTLTTINLTTQDVEHYPLAQFSQELTLGIAAATGGSAQTALTFDSGGSLVAINLATDVLASYPIPADARQQWLSGTSTATGSVVAFYGNGTLTTIDVGTGKVSTFDIGSFSDAFTVNFGSGATAATYVAFYNNQTAILTVVNLTAGNLTPAQNVGVWTAEFAPSSSTVLAFYDNGTLIAEDLSTGHLDTYAVGAYTAEFTTSPATATLGVLVFYDAGTATAANLSTGATTTLANVGQWTEEWTGSTFSMSTAPPSPSAAPSTGSPSAAAASGSNLLAFYNGGTVIGVDVAAGTVNTLLTIASVAPEDAATAPSVSMTTAGATSASTITSQIGPVEGAILEQDFKTFKTSLRAVVSQASGLAKSMPTAADRPRANNQALNTLQAEKADVKLLGKAIHALASIRFARVASDFNKLRLSPNSESLIQRLAADISRLNSELGAAETKLLTLDSNVDEAVIPPPAAASDATIQTAAEGHMAFDSTVFAAKNVVTTFMNQLVQ